MPYSLTDFDRFCKKLVLDNGKHMRLEPHEKTIARSHFDGAEEIVIVIPKKNGKTTLLAAMALYHVLRVRDADCIIVAASRDQATILLKQAYGLARRSDLLFDSERNPGAPFKAQLGYRRIIGMNEASGMLRALASDIDTLDGEIPSLVLVDELHRHKKDETYSVLRLSLGGRGGKMLTISTAGATMNSPLGRIRTTAHDSPSFTRDEPSRYNHAQEGSFVFHEWCLSDADDPEDMETVKLANPASWRSVGILSKERQSPGVTPWSWLRFACGVWTEGEEPWLEPATWDACADEDLFIDDGSTVVLGVDVDTRKQEYAIVVLRSIEDQLWVKARLGAGPLGVVEDDIRELADTYNVDTVCYMDRAFERSADLLEGDGLTMVMVPDSPKRKEQVAATLHKVIEDNRLRHDGDQELRAQVLAGRVKESESGWRFVRDPNLPRPIGALTALAVAVHVKETEPKTDFMVAFT